MEDWKKILIRSENLIKQENYSEALHILNPLLDKFTNNERLNWTVGLIYAQLGKPRSALNALKKITTKNHNKETLIKKISHSLPIYEKINNIYNDALTKIKNGQYEEALSLIQKLMGEELDVPLPIEVYRSYLLLLLYLGQDKQYEDMLEQGPGYLKNDSVIKNIHQEFMIQKANKAVGSANKKVIQSRWFTAIAAIFALASIVLIFQDSFQDAGAELVTPVINRTNEVEELESVVAKLMDQLQSEKQMNQQFNDFLQEKDNAIKELEEKWTILDDAGIKIDDLSFNAAKETYEQGLNYYQENNYSEAIIYLKKSLEYETSQYFSDDAHFYLIQSFLKQDMISEAKSELDLFIDQKNLPNYQASPYYDDVLLERALLALDENDLQTAQNLLEILDNDYATEWTGIIAQQLMEEHLSLGDRYE